MFLTFALTYAQVGIETSSPEASAALDMNAINKGFLPPRVELLHARDIVTIPNPATGLFVYATGLNSANLKAGYYYFDGEKWTELLGIRSPDLAGRRTYAFIGDFLEVTGANNGKGVKIGENLYFSYRRPSFFKNNHTCSSNGIWPALTQDSSASKTVHLTGTGAYHMIENKLYGYNQGNSTKYSSFDGRGIDSNADLSFLAPSAGGHGSEVMQPNIIYPAFSKDVVHQVGNSVTLDIFIRIPAEKRFIKLYVNVVDVTDCPGSGTSATNPSENSGMEFNILATEYKF